MNRVNISGRLGKDPELKKTANGTSICDFSIAIEEYKKDEEAPANWIDIRAWKHSADFLCDNAQKGDKVFIEGRLQTDTWEKDGQKHRRTFIQCERLEMLPKVKEESSQRYDYGDGMGTNSIPGIKTMKAEDYESDDPDLPF